MPQPLTILASCHNHNNYLNDFFGSLYYSRFKDFKLIVSDDASTDGSQETIKAWSSLIPMDIYLHEKNQGGSGRENIKFLFNRPIDTPYTQLIDCDDYMFHDNLERKLAYLDNPMTNYVAVHSEVSVVNAESVLMHNTWWRDCGVNIEDPTTFEYLIKDNRVFICSLMARTAEYKKAFDFDLLDGVFLGDFAMILRLSKMGAIGYIDTPLAFYRHRDKSESHRDRQLTIDATNHVKRLAASGELLKGI